MAGKDRRVLYHYSGKLIEGIDCDDNDVLLLGSRWGCTATSMSECRTTLHKNLRGNSEDKDI